MADRYGYSIDYEEYVGCYDSREDALLAGAEAALDQAACEGLTGPHIVRTARAKPSIETLGSMVRWIGELICCEIEDRLCEEIGGHDGHQVMDLPPGTYEAIGRSVVEHLLECATFRRWQSIDEQEHEIREEDYV